MTNSVHADNSPVRANETYCLTTPIKGAAQTGCVLLCLASGSAQTICVLVGCFRICSNMLYQFVGVSEIAQTIRVNKLCFCLGQQF